MLIPLFIANPLPEMVLSVYRNAGFELLIARTEAEQKALFEKRGNDLRAALTNGFIGFTRAQMEALPYLEMISVFGVGYENVDLAAAKEKNIMVTNGPNTNTDSVADHAMALLFAITRDIVNENAAVTQKKLWDKARHLRPTISGKRIGILGLGKIGEAIARRAAKGFEMQVGYHNRHPKVNYPYQYFESLPDLAEWADYLVVAAPGGKDTKGLVNSSVLQSLGSKGFLINIARGSIVNTSALIEALQTKQIMGAAIDVIDDEPNIPEAICHLDNLIITPHCAASSPEAMLVMAELSVKNLIGFFEGSGVTTPVAEMAE